jgi:hypothetical protein
VASKCQQVDLEDGDHLRYVQCTRQSTRLLWCPSWVHADSGVLPLCDEHAKHFNEAIGMFYWDDAATKAFAESHPSVAGKLRLRGDQ